MRTALAASPPPDGRGPEVPPPARPTAPSQLPADVRASLEKAMAEATAFANGVAQQDNDEAIEAMKKSGKTEMVELTAEQKAAWHKVLDPVATEMESRVGPEILQAVYKETGFDPAKL